MLINIENTINNVIKKADVFVSEMDFQHSLGNELKSHYQQYDIYMGYRVQGELYGSAMHIDIVLLKEDTFIPIEIKYKTKGQTVKNRKEEYKFKRHGAYPDNCKRYLDDIIRIKKLRNYPYFKEGYSIFLTDDEKYVELFKKESVGKNALVNMNDIKNRNWITQKSNSITYYFLVNTICKGDD